MTAVIQQHIRINDAGVAWVDDTNIKVVEVVQDHLGFGWSAEEIAQQHEGTLSLSQVYSALSHYYDNKEVFDQLIEQINQKVEEIKAMFGETPGRRKLRELGLRP